MSEIADAILEDLASDLSYHGIVEQCAKTCLGDSGNTWDVIASTLTELLSTGTVEIGFTVAIPSFVEFVAWKGTVAERVQRAKNAVAEATDIDKTFAYWLCLTKNINRLEA